MLLISEYLQLNKIQHGNMKISKKFKIDKFFEEKASGKSTNRPILKEMLQFVRDGDTLYIESFSRLARNTKDLLDIIEQLKKRM